MNVLLHHYTVLTTHGDVSGSVSLKSTWRTALPRKSSEILKEKSSQSIKSIKSTRIKMHVHVHTVSIAYQKVLIVQVEDYCELSLEQGNLQTTTGN